MSNGGDALERLAAELGHRFARPEFLGEAMTHPSAAAGVPSVRTYERMEFLGDRVLGLVVAERLFARYPDDNEGDLARRHAALVSRTTLVAVAEEIDLGPYLNMPRGEITAGTHRRPAILADACEAMIGALYLDGGLDAAGVFIGRFWDPLIEAAPPQESKTQLQEWAQGRGKPLPRYRTILTEGPPHEPVFTVELDVEGCDPVQARGGSKRAAEQEAARRMLEGLETVAEAGDDR